MAMDYRTVLGESMDLQNVAIMSAKRAQIYQTLINVFMWLPDDKFHKYIYSPEFKQFLEQHKKLQYPIITKGVDLIEEFLRKNKMANANELLEKLAVDRTKLIRVPYSEGLKAPYESHYHKEMKTSSSLKRLTAAYRKAGFVPSDAKESPDFFCVELDFMRVLSKSIANEPTEAKALFKLQNEFLNEHLGKWIASYIESATSQAETDFYKGWLLILQGFLEIEKLYLQSY
jgi:TorA maturation chaperone TorD